MNYNAYINSSVEHLVDWFMIAEGKVRLRDFDGIFSPEREEDLPDTDALHREMLDTFRFIEEMPIEHQNTVLSFALVPLDKPAEIFLLGNKKSRMLKLYAMARCAENARAEGGCWHPQQMLADFFGSDRPFRYTLFTKLDKGRISTEDFVQALTCDAEKTEAIKRYAIGMEEQLPENTDLGTLCIEAGKKIYERLTETTENMPVFRRNFLELRTDYIIEGETLAGVFSRLSAEDLFDLFIIISIKAQDHPTEF